MTSRKKIYIFQIIRFIALHKYKKSSVYNYVVSLSQFSLQISYILLSEREYFDRNVWHILSKENIYTHKKRNKVFFIITLRIDFEAIYFIRLYAVIRTCLKAAVKIERNLIFFFFLVRSEYRDATLRKENIYSYDDGFKEDISSSASVYPRREHDVYNEQMYEILALFSVYFLFFATADVNNDGQRKTRRGIEKARALGEEKT